MCRLCAILTLCLVACDPFNLSPTDNKNHLELNTEYDIGHKLIDTLSIKLLWSDITIDNFKEIEITRYNFHREYDSYPIGKSINGWYSVANTDNFFTTTWGDIIRDDAPFKYRLRYYDTNGDYFEATNSIFIMPTTSVFVPLEFATDTLAAASYVIDKGDTIFKCLTQFDAIPDTYYFAVPDTIYQINRADSILVIEIKCEGLAP